MNIKYYLGAFLIGGFIFALIFFINANGLKKSTPALNESYTSKKQNSQNSILTILSIPNFTANASGNYVAKNRVFEATLPKQSQGQVKIANAKSITFTPIKSQAIEAKINGNKITYENAYLSSDIEYITTDKGIKESIIFHSPDNLPEEFSYNFDAQDLQSNLNNDNSITFTQISKEPARDIPVSDGSTLNANKAANFLPEHPIRFKIPAPIMIDANGNKSQTSDVKVILDKDTLTLIPSKEWLGKAKFPVILDPTVEVTPQIVQELAERRTATAKEFLNDDGTFTSVIFQNPIHYQDGTNFKDIDKTFKESADPNYKFQVTTGIYTARLKKTLSGNSDINLAFSNTNIGLSPSKIGWNNGDSLGNVNNVNGSISGDGSKITYKSLFGITGIDLEGIYDNEKFLKETVINTKESIQAQNHTNDNLEITFNLDIPLDVELKVNGNIWDKNSSIETTDKITVIKNGQEISDLKKAIVYSQNSNNSQTIKIKLAKNGNRLTLTKIIPGAWLSRAPYPIRTDTTDTIYGVASDGYIESSTGGSYSIARDGTEALVAATTDGDNIIVGQRDDQCCNYYVWQGFIGFNTSPISSDSVSSATLSLYLVSNDSGNDFTQEVRLKSWTTGGLTTADWIAGASLSSSTLLATDSTAGITAGYNDFTSEVAFLTNINGSGNTELILDSAKQVSNTTPTQDEFVTWQDADFAGTTQDPKLIVIHAPAVAGGINVGPGININQGTNITTN